MQLDNKREYLPPVGQSQKEVSQVNTFQSAQALATEPANQCAQSNAFAQISPHPGPSHAQDIKICSLSQTLNIFPETKHYFPLRNSFLL